MDVQKEFSENYMEEGALYKNAENKLKAMRKKLEDDEPDESGDKPIDDSWIQAVKIWIEIENAAKAKKTEKIFKAAKKKAESYAAYKLREDLVFNKGKKKLVTLSDFDEDEEEYFTEDRDKSTGSEDDDNDDESAIDIPSRSATPVINSSTTTSRSSSMVPSKRKKQAQKLPRTEMGKKRKPRIDEIAFTISKLDGVIAGLGSLVSGEKDKEN
jgi:hypothetical protein